MPAASDRSLRLQYGRLRPAGECLDACRRQAVQAALHPLEPAVAGVSHRVLSAYSDERFGEDWGVLIKAPPLRRVLQRAVFVLDRDDTVRYVEYCPEIADQPDFDRALEVADELSR